MKNRGKMLENTTTTNSRPTEMIYFLFFEEKKCKLCILAKRCGLRSDVNEKRSGRERERAESQIIIYRLNRLDLVKKWNCSIVYRGQSSVSFRTAVWISSLPNSLSVGFSRATRVSAYPFTSRCE